MKMLHKRPLPFENLDPQLIVGEGYVGQWVSVRVCKSHYLHGVMFENV